MKERLQLAVEVRDAIEVVNSSSEYPKFIAAFMPALTAVLESTPAQLSDGPEHKLRNTTLEILNRMPHTEALEALRQAGAQARDGRSQSRRMRKTRSSACA